MVYPNPSSGKLFFTADTTGKNYELNVDVKSGMYFVEIIDTNTDTYYKQKLMIQK